MTRFIHLVYISVLLVLNAAPAAAKGDNEAEPPATRPSGAAATQPRPKLRGEYALVAAEVGLTAEKKAELAAIVVEERDAEARMRTANQKKLEKLQKDLADARKEDNKDAIVNILHQIMRINAAETKAKKAFQERVMGFLTHEQQARSIHAISYRLTI